MKICLDILKTNFLCEVLLLMEASFQIFHFHQFKFVANPPQPPFSKCLFHLTVKK